jgi:hypothetical protein
MMAQWVGLLPPIPAKRARVHLPMPVCPGMPAGCTTVLSFDACPLPALLAQARRTRDQYREKQGAFLPRGAAHSVFPSAVIPLIATHCWYLSESPA